eukprot:761871-Hanusia_phi.AAC.1
MEQPEVEETRVHRKMEATVLGRLAANAAELWAEDSSHELRSLKVRKRNSRHSSLWRAIGNLDIQAVRKNIFELEKQFGMNFLHGEIAEIFGHYINMLDERNLISIPQAKSLLAELSFFNSQTEEFLDETINQCLTKKQIIFQVIQGSQIEVNPLSSGIVVDVSLGSYSYQSQTVVNHDGSPVWNECISFFVEEHHDIMVLNVSSVKERTIGVSKSRLGTMKLDCASERHTRFAWRTLYNGEECSSDEVPSILLSVHAFQSIKQRSDELRFSDSLSCIRAQNERYERTIRSAFPIDPESSIKMGWDFLVMILLMYTSFSVPYTLAFDDAPVKKTSYGPLDIWDLTLDVIFCLDIAISFYLTGSLPFDKIILAATSSESSSGSSLRALRFIRLLKIVRAIRFVKKLSQVEENDTSGNFRNVINVFRAVFVGTFGTHFFGCMFVLLIDRRAEHTWLWVYEHSLIYADNFKQYITASYWAVSTVNTLGYGDVTPSDHIERVYTVFVIILGAVGFQYASGSTILVILRVKSSEFRFQEMITALLEYLDFRSAHVSLKRRINRYFATCWRWSGDLYSELPMVDSLPKQMKSRIFVQLASLAEQRIPLFKGFDHITLGELWTRVQLQDFMPDEVIYHAGEAHKQLYFVSTGTVELRLTRDIDIEVDSQQTSKLRKVTYLSSGEWFGQENLFPSIRRTYFHQARSLASTTCYVIKLSTIHELKLLFPHLFDKLYSYCSAYYASHLAPYDCPEFDLPPPDRNFSKMDQLIAEQKQGLISRQEALFSAAQNIPQEVVRSPQFEKAYFSWRVRNALTILSKFDRVIIVDTRKRCIRVLHDEVPKGGKKQIRSTEVLHEFGIEDITLESRLDSSDAKIRFSRDDTKHSYEFESVEDKNFFGQLLVQLLNAKSSTNASKEPPQTFTAWVPITPAGAVAQNFIFSRSVRWGKAKVGFSREGELLYFLLDEADRSYGCLTSLGFLTSLPQQDPEQCELKPSSVADFQAGSCVVTVKLVKDPRSSQEGYFLPLGLESNEAASEFVVWVKEHGIVASLPKGTKRAQARARESSLLHSILSHLNLLEYLDNFLNENIDDSSLELLARDDLLRMRIPLGKSLLIWEAINSLFASQRARLMKHQAKEEMAKLRKEVAALQLSCSRTRS